MSYEEAQSVPMHRCIRPKKVTAAGTLHAALPSTGKVIAAGNPHTALPSAGKVTAAGNLQAAPPGGKTAHVDDATKTLTSLDAVSFSSNPHTT